MDSLLLSQISQQAHDASGAFSAAAYVVIHSHPSSISGMETGCADDMWSLSRKLFFPYNVWEDVGDLIRKMRDDR